MKNNKEPLIDFSYYKEFEKLWGAQSKKFNCYNILNEENFMKAYEYAVKSYDKSRGKFSTHASQVIKASFVVRLNNSIKIKSGMDVDTLHTGVNVEEVANSKMDFDTIIKTADDVLTDSALSIFKKHFVEDFDYGHIAKELSISKQAVSKSIGKSLARIKEGL